MYKTNRNFVGREGLKTSSYMKPLTTIRCIYGLLEKSLWNV